MKHVRELFQPSVRLVAHPVGPNTKLINIRRGEGGEGRRGGPLWSPASCSLC